jgi:hypothetical protein
MNPASIMEAVPHAGCRRLAEQGIGMEMSDELSGWRGLEWRIRIRLNARRVPSNNGQRTRQLHGDIPAARRDSLDTEDRGLGELKVRQA